jgi:hypothetical protein
MHDQNSALEDLYLNKNLGLWLQNVHLKGYMDLSDCIDSNYIWISSLAHEYTLYKHIIVGL